MRRLYGTVKVTSSYKVRIYGAPRSALRATLVYYREMLDYLIPIVDEHYEYIMEGTSANECMMRCDHIVHTTKAYKAQCDFDQVFPNVPSYLRRSACQAAIASVQSYRSAYENGNANLASHVHAYPVFYRCDVNGNGGMYHRADDCIAKIKLYNGKSWSFYTIRFDEQDARYVERNWSGVKAKAPVLLYKRGRAYLTFAFERSANLPKISIDGQIVCAVDYGIGTTATCSIIDATGTILARKFIDDADDKACAFVHMGRIRRYYRKHGPVGVQGRYEFVKRDVKRLVSNVVNQVIDFALRNGAHVIVCEHLDFSGSKPKGIAQELQHLRCRYLQQVLEFRAHRVGMRFATVNSWNTSRLAYDGSGVVKRGWERIESDHPLYGKWRKHRLSRREKRELAKELPCSMCEFANGKVYNCDLNASYNIGARYFIREILKSLPVTAVSQVQAEVPELARRTSCTLSSLWKLHRLLSVQVQDCAAV